jgi:hypothetical protein
VAWASPDEHEKANAMDASFNSKKDDPRLIAL